MNSISRKIFFAALISLCLVLAADAGNFNVLYRSGLKKLYKRDYAGALVKFKKAYDSAELSNEEVKIIFAIANAYSGQKKYKDAHNWIVRLFDIPDLTSSQKTTAYRRLIYYSKRLKRYDDALEEVGTALNDADLADQKAVFLNERAKVYEEQKKYPEAEKIYRESLKACTKNSPQLYSTQRQILAILYKQKKYQAALDYMAKLKIDKWDTYSKRIGCYYAGLCAHNLGKCQLAITWFERMPPNPPAWLAYSRSCQLGSCYSRLGKHEKAYKCYEQVYENLKLNSYYRANALWLMASKRYWQKNYKEAKRLCEDLIKFPKATKSQRQRAENLLKSIKKYLKQ
jgi:tetratricopeptide (TPR) repeat protein